MLIFLLLAILLSNYVVVSTMSSTSKTAYFVCLVLVVLAIIAGSFLFG